MDPTAAAIDAFNKAERAYSAHEEFVKNLRRNRLCGEICDLSSKLVQETEDFKSLHQAEAAPAGPDDKTLERIDSLRSTLIAMKAKLDELSPTRSSQRSSRSAWPPLTPNYEAPYTVSPASSFGPMFAPMRTSELVVTFLEEALNTRKIQEFPSEERIREMVGSIMSTVTLEDDWKLELWSVAKKCTMHLSTFFNMDIKFHGALTERVPYELMVVILICLGEDLHPKRIPPCFFHLQEALEKTQSPPKEDASDEHPRRREFRFKIAAVYYFFQFVALAKNLHDHRAEFMKAFNERLPELLDVCRHITSALANWRLEVDFSHSKEVVHSKMTNEAIGIKTAQLIVLRQVQIQENVNLAVFRRHDETYHYLTNSEMEQRLTDVLLRTTIWWCRVEKMNDRLNYCWPASLAWASLFLRDRSQPSFDPAIEFQKAFELLSSDCLNASPHDHTTFIGPEEMGRVEGPLTELVNQSARNVTLTYIPAPCENSTLEWTHVHVTFAAGECYLLCHEHHICPIVAQSPYDEMFRLWNPMFPESQLRSRYKPLAGKSGIIVLKLQSIWDAVAASWRASGRESCEGSEGQ